MLTDWQAVNFNVILSSLQLFKRWSCYNLKVGPSEQSSLMFCQLHIVLRAPFIFYFLLLCWSYLLVYPGHLGQTSSRTHFYSQAVKFDSFLQKRSSLSDLGESRLINSEGNKERCLYFSDFLTPVLRNPELGLITTTTSSQGGLKYMALGLETYYTRKGGDGEIPDRHRKCHSYTIPWV